MTVQNALEEMKERAFAPAFQKYLFDTYKVLAQTDFSEEDMEQIYIYLGNRCNHAKTLKFIASGYDMSVLKD